MIALLSLLLLAFPASGFAEQFLKILQPAESQPFTSSNVTISIQFGFDIQSDPKLFQAWLNGKPVGALFTYTDTRVATATLSPKDGLEASDKGRRMNVFAAEVEGPDGFKYREMVRFTVDCSGNHAPVASVTTADTLVFSHELVQLDGTGSSDADGDALAYKWSLVSSPKQSKAAFINPAAINPTFIPDVPGTYVAQLVVNDYKTDSQPKTVTIEVVPLKILIERPVNDTIYDILSKHGIVTQSDALSDIQSHHVAILDGNGIGADDIKNSKLLKSALTGGRWGIVLNVSEEQKKVGLIPHLGIVSHGKSKAMLFRRLYSGNTPVIRILELPTIDPEEIKTDPDIYLRYAGMLLKKLRESLMNPEEVLPAAPSPDSPIPPNLINVRWDYRSVLPFTFDHSGRQSVTKGRTQFGKYIVNYTFTLFLDNGGKPTGNKQYLLAQVDTQSNPNDTGSDWMASDGDMSKHNEYAWFQDYIKVSIFPAEADPQTPQ